MYTPDSDTFLVALYTITDDLYKTYFPETKSKVGPKRVMTDSEIILPTEGWSLLPMAQMARKEIVEIRKGPLVWLFPSPLEPARIQPPL